MALALTEKLNNIIDSYYRDSDDYRYLRDILEEVEFLYSHGILKVGRFIDILQANDGD